MINAAVVGLGTWGKTMVESLASGSDLMRFTALQTRSVTPDVEAFARQHSLAIAKTYEAVLADPKIDAVVLATPVSGHVQQIEMAAAAGKHVYCEKPFTFSRKEAEQALAALAKAGRVTGIGYNRRFHPEMIKLHDRIEAGDLGTAGAAGDAARGAAGLRIDAIGNAENESYGIELGYSYADSEVICADPGADILDNPLHYIPTTAPGVRMPSVLLDGGAPIFDRLGLWFTLACFGTPPSDALVAAAAQRGLPLTVLRVDDPHIVGVYGRGMLLVRPDQHIAWRGKVCEDRHAADAVLSRVLGFGASA